MANQEHYTILKQGEAEWNQWRQENPDIQPDLSVVDLSNAWLKDFDLHQADLRGTYLPNANLVGADLSAATLDGAILSGAKLTSARLNNASLVGADLRSVYFDQTKLCHAQLPEADLRWATLYWADLRGANLSRAMLNYATIIDTGFQEANLSGCSLFGISVWNVDLEGAIQSNLIITPPEEPAITVDNLEIAQFIYLLLNHKKLRNVLNSVTERGVLILGRFRDGGLELLQAIAEKLREMKYLPIIFDFDRPKGRNLTETVMTLVGLSRFVIVDLIGSSVPNELRATVPHFKIPFIPIIEEGRKEYSMFADFLENDWVLSPVEFTSKEHLLELLPSKVVEPAEKMCEERQKRLKQIFDR